MRDARFFFQSLDVNVEFIEALLNGVAFVIVSQTQIIFQTLAARFERGGEGVPVGGAQRFAVERFGEGFIENAGIFVGIG